MRGGKLKNFVYRTIQETPNLTTKEIAAIVGNSGVSTFKNETTLHTTTYATLSSLLEDNVIMRSTERPFRFSVNPDVEFVVNSTVKKSKKTKAPAETAEVVEEAAEVVNPLAG